MNRPPVVVLLDDTGLEHPLDQFLDIEGVAVGCIHHELDQRLGDVVRLLEDLAQQLAALAAGERVEWDPIVELTGLAPTGIALGQRRPGRCHHKHGAPLEANANLLEPAERAFVRPMEILEQHDDGRFAGEVGEVFGEIGAGTVVQPLRVVTDTAEMRAITYVETEPVGDDVRAGLGSSAERCRHSVFPLGSDRVWIVALLDVEPGGHHLAEQHMGEVLRRRRGSAAEPPNRIGDLGQPTIELAQQARLAHPCIPHDGDDPRPALVHNVLEGLLEFEELGVPPDGLCLHPLDAPAFIELEPARPLSDDHVAVDRAVDTLERECPEWAEGEAAAYMPVGVA